MNDPMSGKADLGSELRRLRISARLSLQQMAERCHYSIGHISNVENGAKPAREDFVRACDQALGAGGALIAMLPELTGSGGDHVSTGPSQLPPVARLVGRLDLIAELDGILDAFSHNQSAGIIALDGQPGSGKTTLAVTWSHRIQARFPNGVFFYDLRGYTANSTPADPCEVLESFLRDLGVAPDGIPSTLDRRAALLRTRLNRTRTLLVLDNAASVEQVRPLLPGAPNCLVVVTSRRRLSGLAVREGGRCVTVRPFTSDEALTLFRDTIGADRVDDEPDAAQDIARLCVHLPLAVRVAAERVAAHPDLMLSELAAELSSTDRRLDVLSQDDEAVRAVFSWSYRALETDAARLFRLLSLHPADRFTAPAAAALAGAPLRRTATLLDELSSMRLVDKVGHGHYRQHDLLKAYAFERARDEETDDVRSAATLRLLDWYLHTANRANTAIAPQYGNPSLPPPLPGTPVEPPDFTYASALAWCDSELGNLVAAGQLANQVRAHGHAWRLPLVMWNYLYFRKPWTAWVSLHEVGLASAKASADAPGEAWVLNNLAQAHRERRRFDLAADQLHRALSLRRRLGDRTGQAWTLIGIGYLARDRADHQAAATAFTAAAELFRQVDDQVGEAVAVDGLGEAHRRLGLLDEALGNFTRALQIMRASADRYSEGYTLTRLGTTLASLGRQDEALVHFDLALVVQRDIGDRWGEADTLIARGDALHALRPNDACSSWSAALAILDELGDPRAGDIRRRLDTAPLQQPLDHPAEIRPTASTP